MEKKQIHFTVSIIGRGKGQTAVAAAAYRSGSRLFCEYENVMKDYSRKRHVTYSEIFLPKHAPAEYRDREKLWNAVDSFEKGKRAQLSRQVEFSLPREIPRKDQVKAARKMAEFFRAQGMVVDLNIHEPDHENPNPHCHLMLTMRPFEQDGTFVKYKSRREYILDKNGEKIPLRNGKDFKTRKVSVTDWDDKGNVEKWRAVWSSIETEFYQKNGCDIVAEHRSFQRQGVGFIPTIHMGPAVTAMERRGIRTEIGNLNREIRAFNAELIKANKEMELLSGQKKELQELMAAAARKEKEDANPIISLLMEWQNGRAHYLQENGIRERASTKTGNLKDYAAMIAYLQKNNIRAVDDLMGRIEKCKRVRSDAVHRYNESGRKIKDLAQLMDNYKLYHPYAAIVRTYESLTGKKKETFARKHPELDTAYAYRASFKSLSGFTAITPRKWQAALEEAKQGRMKLKDAYEQADGELSELSDILDKVLKAEESRQREREQDAVLQAGQHAREGQQKRRKEHGMCL